MFNIKKKNFKKLDFLLFFTLVALCIYGLVVLNSATKNLQRNYMTSQIIATVLGFICIGIILCIDVDFIKRLYLPIYFVCLGLLVLVLFVGTGEAQWGARSWIAFGPISFQPSEIAKIGMVISMAQLISLNQANLNKPLTLLKVLAFCGAPIVLISRQPDFGTGMVFIIIICAMLFTAGLSYKYIIGAIVAGLAALPVIYFNLTDTQKNRILNFLDPARDVSNTGYQAIQGRIAIGSGQLFGKGLYQGTQAQFGFVPERQTDYIFSVLAEELGFVGGAVLILLYFILLYRCVMIARNTQDSFSSLVVIGNSAMLLAHIFENIGMTIGVMPITGIPLPFFSYGGTFQIVNLIAIGMVLSIGAQREPLDFL